MAIDRTLEELKLILAASYRAEEAMENRLGSRLEKLRIMDPSEDFLNELNLSSKEGKELSLKKTSPNLIGAKRKRIKKIREDMRGYDGKDYKGTFFEKRRRKIVADQLRSVRSKISDPKKARAHLYDILRADSSAAKRLGSIGWDGETELPIRSKNPLGFLMGSARRAGEGVIDDESYSRGNFMDGMEDNMEHYRDQMTPDDVANYKRQSHAATPKGIREEIGKNPDSKLSKRFNRSKAWTFADLFGDKKAFNKRSLRRASLSDLKELLALSLADFDPDGAKSIINEIALRGHDELNRGMGRRNMMGRTAGHVIKPALPKGVTGVGGSSGEKVAKTFLRLLTRRKGL